MTFQVDVEESRREWSQRCDKHTIGLAWRAHCGPISSGASHGAAGIVPTKARGLGTEIALVGDVDPKFECLEEAVQERGMMHIGSIAVNPIYDPYGSDPRSQEILLEINWPGLDG